MKKTILSVTSGLAIAFALTGCASQSLEMPSAATLPPDQVAVLKIDRSVKSNGLTPQLNAIADVNGVALLESRGFHDYYKIKIAPGTYTVQLKVYSYNYAPAFPKVTLQVEAGKTYLFTSSIVLNGKAVRVEYLPVETSADSTPEE
ncbi:hypothetical protein ACN22W_10565 [Burkholderia theae]|uniref:hypothetical protein n=1 Tax=Burkholderia theae TaxID=3143496 RepID=UPI003AFB433A